MKFKDLLRPRGSTTPSADTNTDKRELRLLPLEEQVDTVLNSFIHPRQALALEGEVNLISKRPVPLTPEERKHILRKVIGTMLQSAEPGEGITSLQTEDWNTITDIIRTHVNQLTPQMVDKYLESGLDKQRSVAP